MDITPDQVRAARALLRLEQAELARRAHVSVVTIRRLEAINGRAHVKQATFEGIRRALEQAGAEFIPEGVRRRTPANPRAQALFDELNAISLRSAEELRGREILSDDDLYDEDGLPA
jgi:transcriptional regulator with XRE-family HTH domain